jgi:uncharacterized protein (TIGR03000 family)
VSRIRDLALVAPVLLLTAAGARAAPPALYSPHYVSPPSYYHYPSNSNYNTPYYRSPSNYFAPPVSYYERPYPAAPSYLPPAPPPTRPPPTTSGLDVPLVPPALREPESREAPAQIEVRVPAGAEVWFGGSKTRRTGTVRLFESPPLEPGKWFSYDVKARWTEGGKEVEQTRKVSIAAGFRSAVDFTKPGGK